MPDFLPKNTIPVRPGSKFVVYTHKLVTECGDLLQKEMIALKDPDGLLTFTDLDKYVRSSTKAVIPIDSTGNQRAYYVTAFLNYIFFEHRLASFAELTVDIVKDFLQAYASCSLVGDSAHTVRAESTVNTCVQVIFDFLINILHDRKAKGYLGLDEADLFRTIHKRNQRGKVIDVKVPIFSINYKRKPMRPIFRDLPNKVFNLLYSLFYQAHPDLLGLFALSAFAGLRPSEACNVRRIDSVLGPGFIIKEVDGEVISVAIDLAHEFNLRSDLVSVGKIKKERVQYVPQIFLPEFTKAYNRYNNANVGRKYESDYGAFSTLRNGRAITYDSWRCKFQAIVKKELVPLLLKSDDSELRLFGLTLTERSLSPHVLRHWFTVQLVLAGADLSSLMNYRGDSSPMSALTYLNDKDDLFKRYTAVNEETFKYINWGGEKILDQNH